MNTHEFEQAPAPVVLFSDAHGRWLHMQKLMSQYPGAVFISNGDAIGPPPEYGSTRDTIELLLWNNVICGAGNHEGYLLGGATAESRADRESMSRIWVSNYDRGISREYGVNRKKKDTDGTFVQRVWDALHAVGHARYFEELLPYVDIPGEAIAVHAGLVDNIHYEDQLRDLDTALTPERIAERAVQIFGAKNHKLAGSKFMPKNAGLEDRNIDLVTGHKHGKQSAQNRKNGNRVQLAGDRSPGSALYAYLLPERRIVAISKKRKSYQ